MCLDYFGLSLYERADISSYSAEKLIVTHCLCNEASMLHSQKKRAKVQKKIDICKFFRVNLYFATLTCILRMVAKQLFYGLSGGYLERG